jgi:endonuclease YncB( thermonuclease family)
MSGLLRIRGVIDLTQFWPGGSSDADTSKVKVNVRPGSFAFAADGKKFKPTRALDKAIVVGASKKPVIDARSRVTVRLQGIDAPELHYKAPALRKSRTEVTATKRTAYNAENKTERRQYWGETATLALAQKLSTFGAGVIRCEVYSFVDHPYELMDTYGRVVGNLRVGKKFGLDLNTWLTEQGWVFPAFYSSMSEEEIQTLLAAALKGRQQGRVWSTLVDDTSKFKPKLVYRKGGPIDTENDQGALILPKLFRRQVAYKTEVLAKVFNGSYAEFLADRPDECYLTGEFLDKGPHSAPTHRLAEFMKGKRFQKQAEDVVFREKFSTVVNSAGQRIDDF